MVGLAVLGVAFSIFNFYLLANIYPLERRVAAIEDRNAKVDPLVSEFIEMKGTFKAMQEDIAEIKGDMKYIIELHTR